MKGAGAKFPVIGNRNGDRGISGAFLHHDVAAASPNLSKSMCCQNRAGLRA